MLCGIVYRHLSGGVNIFQDYMNIIHKIHRENKQCIILGDFDLDFLKFESHPPTDEFMTSLSTSSFKPCISTVQPTRIKNHSATLVDNIFLTPLNILLSVGI